MTAQRAFVFGLFFASTVATLPAFSQTYQWKDASGQTVISDTPPPANAKGKRSFGGQPQYFSEKPAEKTDEAAKAPEAPKTAAERDMEFKKRQQEYREKAEKQAKEQAAENTRRDNCDRARRNLAALESNQAVTTLDSEGKRQMMDQNERAQEIERARQMVTESCK